MSYSKSIINDYVKNYIDVPAGTGKIIPLIILESLGMSVSFYISIYFVHSLGFSPLQVGELVSAQSIGTCVGALFSGYLTTHISERMVAMFGCMLFGLGFFCLSMLHAHHLLLAVMFVCGLGGIFLMVGNMTALIKLADDAAMKRRLITLKMAIFNFCVSLAGAALGFLNKSGISKLFLFMSLFLVVASYVIYKLIGDDETKTTKKGYVRGAEDLPLIGMIVPSVAMYGFIFAIVRTFFAASVASKFHNPWLIWIVLSANPFIVVFVQPYIVGKIKNISGPILISSGALLLGLGYSLYGVSQTIVPALFFVCVACLGEMIFSPVSKELASKSLGKGNEGMGLSLWKMTYYLSGIFGASIAGFVGDAYGSTIAWSMCSPLALVVLLSVLLFSYFKRDQHLTV